jgi:hypothetical protein
MYLFSRLPTTSLLHRRSQPQAPPPVHTRSLPRTRIHTRHTYPIYILYDTHLNENTPLTAPNMTKPRLSELLRTYDLAAAAGKAPSSSAVCLEGGAHAESRTATGSGDAKARRVLRLAAYDPERAYVRRLHILQKRAKLAERQQSTSAGVGSSLVEGVPVVSSHKFAWSALRGM